MYTSIRETLYLYSDPYSSFLEHFKNNDYSIMDDARYLNDFLQNTRETLLDHEKLFNDFKDEFNIHSRINLIKENVESDATKVFKKANLYYQDEFEGVSRKNVIGNEKKALSGGKKAKLNFILNFIKKAISLKAEDLEATNNIRFKALRMALGLLVVGGTMLIPGGLIVNLFKVIVVSAVGAYSAVRLSKLQDMLETQVERLEARMEEEDDPRIKAEIGFAVKGMNKELKKIGKRREQLKKIGKGKNSDKEDW